jgi:LysR family hydrogen peroxide-inducible transcriptional activator
VVERRKSDIVLTDVGLEVANRAEQILAASRDLVDFAQHRSGVLTGRLTLGVIPTVAPYVLPRVLPYLQARFPRLRLEVRETQTSLLLGELGHGALDCVMLALPVEGSDVETLPLFDDPFLLAVPAGEVPDSTTRVGVGDVDQRRLILLEEGHCLRDQALAFCAAPRHDQPAGLGATSLATVMQMVANGYGVTLVPEVAVDVEVRDERVKLLRFTAPEPGRSVGLAWRRTSPRKVDFTTLGQIAVEALAAASNPPGRRANARIA